MFSQQPRTAQGCPGSSVCSCRRWSLGGGGGDTHTHVLPCVCMCPRLRSGVPQGCPCPGVGHPQAAVGCPPLASLSLLSGGSPQPPPGASPRPPPLRRPRGGRNRFQPVRGSWAPPHTQSGRCVPGAARARRLTVPQPWSVEGMPGRTFSCHFTNTSWRKQGAASEGLWAFMLLVFFGFCCCFWY